MIIMPKRKSHLHRMKVVISLVTIFSLLAGCNLPWGRSKEITTPESLEVREDEPEATSEPRQDLPPALVEVSPVSGTAINLNQSISLYFNQAMDTGSVEAAIHFEPRVNGRFSWEDDQILNFTPDQNLEPGTEISMVIDTSAQAANKKGLQAPVAVNYQTADELLGLQVMPVDFAQDVDPESLVFVTFNQPVVPLGAEQAGPPAFSLSPEVPGEGSWLNTTTYIFRPEPSMTGGTTYNITLNESLTGTSGAGFDTQDLVFSFTTTTPQVLEVLPIGSELLSLDGPIEVRFNIRMDKQSVEEHFYLLTPNGRRVTGRFEWQEDFQGFLFTPEDNLDRNTRYVITLDAGAESYGGLPVEAPFETSRTTYPALNVSSSVQPDFRSYYGQYGQYEIQLTAPVSRDNFKDHIQINPEVGSEGLQLSNNNMNLVLNGYFKPDTEYTLTLDPNLEDQWGGALGRSLSYTFVTPSAAPALSLVTGYTSYNLMFVPAQSSDVVLQATNINTLTFEIAPITVGDLLTLVHPDNYEYRQMFLPSDIERSTHNLELTRNISQAVRLPLTYQGNPLSPGVYFLGMTSADLVENGEQVYQRYYLIVSDNHAVMKIAPEQAFIWGTTLSDHTPLAGAPVTVYNTEGDILASGETDSDGFFIEEITRPEEPYANFLAVIGKPGQDDFAFSISTWGQGYALYEQGIRQNTLPREIEAYIYTDRPIYRPGDTVHFKAVLFSRENGLPVPSGMEQVDVAVYGDPGMSGIPINLYSNTLTLSQFGTLEGSVDIPPDASPGMFQIALTQGEQAIESLYFDVAAYRKPEIELTLDLTPDEIVFGGDLTAQLQAAYYFGLPVADQGYSWSFYMDEGRFELPGYQVGPMSSDWIMPRLPAYSVFGERIANGEGFTDEQGQSNLIFSQSDRAIGEVQAGSLQELTLEVTISDESGFPVSYRESAKIHPDTFYIGVKPETYFGNVNTPFSFTILTVDWEKEPVGQVALEASFEAIEWEVEETGRMEMPYQYVERKSLIDTANPITGEDGLSRLSFVPPEPGTYMLTVTSGDAVTESLVWVAGEGTAVWPRQTQNLIELTADAEVYQPGQSAHIFFPNPFPGDAKALVTLERGQVMETQVVGVTGAGYSIEVPITSDSIPNVYISVMLFGLDEDGNPGFRQGINNIKVSPESKTLNVELILDPQVTTPGAPVSAQLLVTDQQGNPVQGEFSVAVVDKALLALVEPNSQPIWEAFYSSQPLAVQTSFSLKTYAMQLALTSELGIGGGGGDMAAEKSLRENFPDTALWEGRVVTGSDGTAQLTIPLPDSLTTWVVDVRGLTEDYLVGQAEGEIITQKELMVQPVTPRFLVDGDRVELAAIVHNNTTESMEVEVSLLGSGFTLEEGTDQSQTLVIDAGTNTRVNWWCLVESQESVELIFQAQSDGYEDAAKPVWGDLQVLRYAMPATFSTAGQIGEEGQVLELVSLPISTDPSSGSLSLELQPSLTASILDSLQAFDSPSFSDTISIVSRMLANVNTYQALQDLGIETPQLESDLSILVGESLQELLEIQKFDGGWSWWGGSGAGFLSSDAFITAYVLHGLQLASDAGFEVGEYYLDRAFGYLFNHLINPGNIEETWELDRLAFQIYALRESNFGLDNYIAAVYNRRSDLNPWSLGLFTLALDQIDGSSAQLNILLGDLEAAAVRSETGVHWESQEVSWMLPGTPLFNTAVGVLTLSALDPASTSLVPALRYLMTHRNALNPASSPFESAWVLMAATSALKGTGDFQADYPFQAFLNDRLFAEGEADSTSIRTSTSILDLHPESPNALVIERGDGPGTLYYRVDLQTYQAAADAEAINRGISVQRAYYLSGEGCPGVDDCTPIDTISLGADGPSQMITVALTLTLSSDMINLMLADFIPSGTEILNQDFLTSQTVQESPIDIYHPRSPFEHGWGWWYFNQPQIYDDHILWTADYVPAGTYTLVYTLVPFQRGTFQVLPSRAWMYFYPEVQGTSAGSLFTID